MLLWTILYFLLVNVWYGIFLVVCSLRKINCSKDKIQAEILPIYWKKNLLRNHVILNQHKIEGICSHLYQCMFHDAYSNLCMKMLCVLHWTFYLWLCRLFHRCLWSSLSFLGSRKNTDHLCPVTLVASDLHMLVVIFVELFIICTGCPLIFPSRKIILIFIGLHFSRVTFIRSQD